MTIFKKTHLANDGKGAEEKYKVPIFSRVNPSVFRKNRIPVDFENTRLTDIFYLYILVLQNITNASQAKTNGTANSVAGKKGLVANGKNPVSQKPGPDANKDFKKRVQPALLKKL